MNLLTPTTIGSLALPNRVVMAPMTRARSGDDHAPAQLVADYYAQRAAAGLIISEATSVSRLSVSRPGTSAIHHAGHAAGWQRVVDAVHARDGRFFLQLYHMGRKSDASRLPPGERPVAPSEIQSQPQAGGANTYYAFTTPRALSSDEVAGVVAEFRDGAMLARQAGCDGVEIHGANGYLIDQFLKDATNRRSDRYGGSIANRVRFLLEIVDAAVGVWGPGRVGVRISPHYRDGGIGNSDPAALFAHVAAELDRMPIAYLHVIEADSATARQAADPKVGRLLPALRRLFRGPLMANGAFSREAADRAIASGAADLVSFGRPYIANPDLVERFRRRAPLNQPDKDTFYVGGARGYVDYPALDDLAAAAPGAGT